MANEHDKIFKLFPTQKHTRIFYPIRPLFTLSLSLLLAGLGIIGLLPLSWGLWLAMMVGSDDLFVTPFFRLIQSCENLGNKRKQAKSILSIIAIIGGLAGGITLGIFIWYHVPVVAAFITSLTLKSGTSATLNALCMTLGALIGRVYKKNTMLCILAGLMLATCLPVTVPLAIECVFTLALATTFVSTILIKYALQAYYKIRYGHTNADGYAFNYQTTESAADQAAAQNLNVTAQEVQTLRVVCMKGAAGVRKRCHAGHGLTGTDAQLKNSFKDIFHLLIQAKDSKDTEVKANLTTLLTTSNELFDNRDFLDTVGMTENIRGEYLQAKAVIPPSFDPKVRLSLHKQGMEAAFFKLESKHDQYAQVPLEFKKAIAPFLRG
jgi:hypothetical protein